MILTQAHLDRLVCPVCQGSLRLVAVDATMQNPDRAGAIDCSSCGRRYPFHDGIPVLIGSRATRP